MSWARAIVLATGFFFLSAIYLGQIPGFFQLASTQATLGLFSQVLLNLGLLTVGLALIGITAAFLYDPKPASRLLVPLFGLLGLALIVAGVALIAFVFSTGHQYLPDQTFSGSGNSKVAINWPDPNQSYLFNSIWFQPKSIDLSGVGFVALMTGGGIFGFVALYPLQMARRLSGALRSMLLQLSIGFAVAILFAYLTMYTFSPDATVKTWGNGAVENGVLAIALMLVLFATQVWLLPIMAEKRNREKFFPALYLHSVMLIGNVAVPLLGLFVAMFPLVYWVNSINLATGYWVQCSSKTVLPGSCTFTSYTGYIVSAIVSGMFFTFMLIAGYLWTKKPAFVRLGTLFAYIFAALAVVVTHTGGQKGASEIPLGLAMAIGIAILGLVWIVSTFREFAPAVALQASLGCVGQWLVMGSTLAIYIAAFAFFSYPNFIETEGNLIITPGNQTIHDAYWVMLIAGGLAALMFAFLLRRQALGQIRKATLWLILIGAGMQIAASIHFDLGDASNPVNYAFYAGVVIEVIGMLAGLWGAFQTRTRGGGLWMVVSVATILVGLGGMAYLIGSGSTRYELVVAFAILMSFGALFYVVLGADPPDLLLLRGSVPVLPTESMPEE